MSFKQAIAAMAILLALLLPGFAVAQTPVFVPGFVDPGPPLAGQNSVSNVELRHQPDGRWTVTFDYFFTGAPMDASIHVEQVVSTGIANEPPTTVFSKPGVMPQRGQNKMTREVTRPEDDRQRFTREVRVQLRAGAWQDVIFSASASMPNEIAWQDQATLQLQAELAAIGADGVVKKAAALIDTESRGSLEQARALLEKVIEREPRTDAAYVELARVVMKTNWSEQGLRQAESLIKSALQIRRDSANARILLGYVYANQRRFPESEAEFTAAAATNPANIWLWTNWGEMLQMQDRNDAAIQKYRDALNRAQTEDTFDRARRHAYRRLFALLETRKEVDGIEALHKRRVQEYTGAFCSGVEYARFLVQQRGDAKAAIALVRDMPASQCDTRSSREVLGLAYYFAWTSGTTPDAELMVHQAKVFFPSGPRLFHSLASSDRTMAAAKRLVANGESVDQVDGRQWNALAYALSYGQPDVAKRLLNLGARTDTPVGADKMPVALVPLFAHQVAGIRLMREAGVDYSKLRHDGASAVDIARSMEDVELLNAVDPKSGAL